MHNNHFYDLPIIYLVFYWEKKNNCMMNMQTLKTIGSVFLSLALSWKKNRLESREQMFVPLPHLETPFSSEHFSAKFFLGQLRLPLTPAQGEVINNVFYSPSVQFPP